MELNKRLAGDGAVGLYLLWRVYYRLLSERAWNDPEVEIVRRLIEEVADTLSYDYHHLALNIYRVSTGLEVLPNLNAATA